MTDKQAFFWRRLHSLSGFFLVIFLIEHFLTNSEAALFIGEDGHGFVKMVNLIHSLPYLPFIEVFLLGVPIIIHAAWGIKYIFTGEFNSIPGRGNKPTLTGYARNHAYTWQRITSWILLVGIIFHVIQMRFLNYPEEVSNGTEKHYTEKPYMAWQRLDDGLYSVAKRLKVDLYDEVRIEEIKHDLDKLLDKNKDLIAANKRRMSRNGMWPSSRAHAYDPIKAHHIRTLEDIKVRKEWLAALIRKPIKEGEVIAAAPDFGVATLLIVRETFKRPLMIGLYTVFVLAAVFHAFNGLWTCLITWGVTLTQRSQTLARFGTVGLMLLVGFLGLIAVWGTYWLNLKF